MIKVISSGRERCGMYESQEVPRSCGKCKSVDTRILNVWIVQGKRKRKRECVNCGHIFVSDSPYMHSSNPIKSALNIS
jgi:Zn ribbon nucleic-acid-binding protein